MIEFGLVVIFFIVFLFIFWFFCVCCQWDDNKTIWQKLCEKRKLAILSIIVMSGVMLASGIMGYKVCPREQKYNALKTFLEDSGMADEEWLKKN